MTAKPRRFRKQISDHFSNEDFNGKYKFKRTLGKGSYGFVCEARLIADESKQFAVKKVERVFENRTEAKRMLRELRILRMLQHCKEIVGLKDILPPKDLKRFDALMVVFEYVDTDLSRLFNSSQYFTSKHVPYIIYQVLLGLKYMHSADICHRDLKPANILINEDCSIRICDFGLSRSLVFNEDESPHPASHNLVIKGSSIPKPPRRPLKRELTRHVVTRWYRAPEVILLDQKWEYMDRVDMWSLGCIMAEMLWMEKENCDHYRKRQPIFPGSSSYPLSPVTNARGRAGTQQDDQLKVIFEVIGTPSPAQVDTFKSDNIKTYLKKFRTKPKVNWKKKFPGGSPEALDMLNGLLQLERKKRYTVDQCLAHGYLKKNRNPKLEQSIKPTKFEFEDIKLTTEEIRELLVDEVLLFNPKLAAKFGLVRTPSVQHLKIKTDEPPEAAGAERKEDQTVS